MEYINRNTLDLELRINYELKNNKNPCFLSLEIDSINKLYIKQILRDKNKEITNKNITSLALRRYLERYRKKYKCYFKYIILATSIKKDNSIVLHGLAFSKHHDKLTKAWTFGNPINQDLVSKIKSKPSFVTFFLKKYINNNHKINTYTSTGFGHDAYKTKLAKILKEHKIEMFPEEHFEQIPFMDGYFISKSGIVISRKRKNPRTLVTYKYNNQIYVNLMYQQKSKPFQICHLMAKTYMELSKVTSLYKVIHLNHNTSDNRLQNLMLMTSI